MDRDDLRRWLDEGLSLEEIGRRAGRHPSTVGYWVAKHGLAAVGAKRHAARGAIPRDVMEALVAEHLPVREIAARVERSPTTVRHWLARHGLSTTATARRRANGGGERGDRFTAWCRRHGETPFATRSDGTGVCLRCRGRAVTERRRRVKQILVEEAGGRCVVCGYDRCMASLQFHHRDPRTKRFTIGSGATLSLETQRAEAAKCVLLCSNCHAEVEAGIVTLPS